MAGFPFITWATTQNITIGVRLGSVGAFTNYTINAGSYGWGIIVTTTQAASGTIANRLAAALDSIIPGAPVCVARYPQDAQGTVAPIVYTIENGSPTDSVDVNFGTLATAQLFGFNAVVVTFPANTTTSTTINPGLTWAPCPRAFSFFQRKRTMLAVSGSEMANVAPTVTGWGTISNATFEASIVPSANIWLDFARRAGFAATAGRNVADPNNLLENLAEAVGNNLSFRYWESNAGFTTFYVTDPSFGDTAARCTPVDEPRYYMVSFNARAL